MTSRRLSSLNNGSSPAKLSAGIGALFFILLIQIAVHATGWAYDGALGVLIAYAFIFDLWELLVFILLAILFLNWQPVLSGELMVFGLIPLFVAAAESMIKWHTWLRVLAAAFLGTTLFSFAVAGVHFLAHPSLFLVDLLLVALTSEATTSLFL